MRRADDHREWRPALWAPSPCPPVPPGYDPEGPPPDESEDAPRVIIIPMWEEPEP